MLSGLAGALANAALALDPTRKARLEALSGRRLRIESHLPPVAADLIIEADAFSIANADRVRPHVIVRGNPPQLLAMLFNAAASAQSGIEIEGDDTLLAELADIFRSIAPDPAAPLEPYLNTDTTQMLTGAVELAVATFRSAMEAASDAARDFAAGHYTTRPSADAFLERLDALRARIDRLDARVDLCERDYRNQNSPESAS
ncbi:MAG: hypothetical protein QGI81_12430 [Pseudomonadales bacterium]|jgi:ubiquinone biosynthesis protein UbiJ|nr:hypothetical protein [Pseudomonadales bacterium]